MPSMISQITDQAAEPTRQDLISMGFVYFFLFIFQFLMSAIFLLSILFVIILFLLFRYFILRGRDQ